MIAPSFSLKHYLAAGVAGAAVVASSAAWAQAKAFDIPAQPAATGVAALARQADVQILISAADAAGRRVNAVHGAYPVDQALGLLLANTGLTVQTTGVGAYTVVRVPERMAANGDDAAQAAALEEVVVTAFGRQARLRDVPVSVQTVSGAELAKQAITDPVSFAVRQPAFRISPSPASEYISLRGVGSSANIGFEQSVGTFLDGTYRGRSRDIRLALFDLDRVEVLRGPQTTFFGNNTIAGALNLISRKPGDVFQTNGSAYYSPAYGEYSIEAGADLPVNDRVALRVAGRQSGQDGYIHDATTGATGPNQNDQIGRISLAWKPTDSVEVDARVDAGRMRDKSVFNIELYNCPPPASLIAASGACARYLAAQGKAADTAIDYSSNANPSFFHYNFVEGETTEKVQLASHTLTFTTAYFDRDYTLLNDPIPVPGAQGGSTVGTSTDLPLNINEHYRQVSQEVRLASDADRRLSYIAGLYYQRGDMDVNLYEGFYFAPLAAATRGALPVTTPVAAQILVGERSRTLSGFLAGAYKITTRLKLNASARYTDVSKRDTRSSALGAAGSIPSGSNFTAFPSAVQPALYAAAGVDAGDFANPSQSSTRLLPAVSLQYDLRPRTLINASYSEGFKAGGFSVGNSSAAFRPEDVNAYEIGLKTSVFDGRADLNLAGFVSRYANLQETVTVTQGASYVQFVQNAAKSDVKGIEINASARPMSGLRLAFNATLLSAKYDDYKNGPCAIAQVAVSSRCVQDLSGVDRAFAPHFSGNVSIAYTHAVFDAFDGSVELTPYFTTRYFVTPTGDPLLAQPGYAKLDARIAIAPRDNRWSFAIVGRNLTNVLSASFRGSVTTSTGSLAALPDPPRSVGFQLNYLFR